MRIQIDANTAANQVSIHAPVWGAKGLNKNLFRYVGVSIHAPVWGANYVFGGEHGNFFRFNPRTRVGCEDAEEASIEVGFVSIHAPVWGANCPWRAVSLPNQFQSTHPCGVRTLDFAVLSACVSFNPRTRVGCEVMLQINDWLGEVSIHAPVWGANLKIKVI